MRNQHWVKLGLYAGCLCLLPGLTLGINACDGGGGDPPPCHAGFDDLPNPPPQIGDPTGTFVVNHWYLGDTNEQDESDPDAWKGIGVDIDGVASHVNSADHCTAYVNKNPDFPTVDPADIKEDGRCGVDNSFGRNLIPLMQQAFFDVSNGANKTVKEGGPTLMIRATPNPQAPNSVYLYMTAQKPAGSVPSFDGTGHFSIESTGLMGTNPADALAQTNDVTLNGNILTAKFPDDVFFRLKLKADYFRLGIKVHHIKLTMVMDPQFKQILKGTLSGVLNTDETVGEAKAAITGVNQSFCTWNGLCNVLDQVRQAQDIFETGKNTAAGSCGAISFGVVFQGVTAHLDGVQPTEPPMDYCKGGEWKNPCAYDGAPP